MRALNQILVDIAQKHGFLPSFDIKWHPYQLNKHVSLSGIEYMTDSLDIAINTTGHPEVIKYSLARIYTDGATDKPTARKSVPALQPFATFPARYPQQPSVPASRAWLRWPRATRP